MSPSAASLNDSLSTMTEILSKAQVIACSCGLASEAVVIMAGNLVRGSFVHLTFNLNTKIGNRCHFLIFQFFSSCIVDKHVLLTFFYPFPL